MEGKIHFAVQNHTILPFSEKLSVEKAFVMVLAGELHKKALP